MKSPSKLSLTILVSVVLVAAVLLGFFWKDIPFPRDLSIRGEVAAVYHPAEGGADEAHFVVSSDQFQLAPLHLNFKLSSSVPIKDPDGKKTTVGALKEGSQVDVKCTVNSTSDDDPSALPALITPTSITITSEANE